MILPTHVEHSFFKHLATFISPCCVRVRSVFRSLFIAAPSKPPRLITVTNRPSDPPPSSSFSTGSRRRGEPGEQKRCRKNKPRSEPASFHATVSSYAELVRAAEELRRRRQSLMSPPVGEGGSRARRDVPPAFQTRPCCDTF